MKKKRTKMTPDELGYKDRGKIKWQGLILSDHTDAIHTVNDKEKQQEKLTKPKQSLTEIGFILNEAYHCACPLTIQTNTLENGIYFQEISCMLLGTDEEKIYFSLKSGRIIAITLEDIRYVEFLDPQTWYQK